MEDEIDISLDDFRRKYADDSGNPTYVLVLPPSPARVWSDMLDSSVSVLFTMRKDSGKL
jgi:hypothetical protein